MPHEQSGNSQPSIDFEEHRHLSRTKGVSVYGPNSGGTAFNGLVVQDDGSILVTGSISSAQSVTAYIAGSITLNAVVNTSAQGALSVTAWIAQSVTLNAVVNTSAAATGNQIVAGTVTVFIADSVTLPVGPVEVRQSNHALLNAHVIGDKAQDTAVPSNPVVVGGRASTAAPANVDADDDAQYFWLDRAGRTAVWDGNNALSIDDGGNSITIDGGVTAWIAGSLPAHNVTAWIAQSVTLNVNQALIPAHNVTAWVAAGTVTLSGLPASATDADDLANAASVAIQARTYEYDGNEGNWDRARHSFYQQSTAITGTGPGTAVDMSECPMHVYTLTSVAVSCSAYSVDLQGSLDASNYFTLINSNSVSGASTQVYVSDKPSRYMRYNVISIGGAAAQLFIRLLAER